MCTTLRCWGRGSLPLPQPPHPDVVSRGGPSTWPADLGATTGNGNLLTLQAESTVLSHFSFSNKSVQFRWFFGTKPPLPSSLAPPWR